MFVLSVAVNHKRRREMANQIVKKYKNGKKIVTFPDGKKKEIIKDEVTAFKQHLLNQKANIERQLTYVDEDLVEIEKSKQVILE
jgi:esterase/lipase